MLHELRNGGGYPSTRSLRSVFADYKHTGESWDVGDNKRYAALNAIAIVSDYRKEENSNIRYFDDSDNDNFHTLRVEDERRVYKRDYGCKNTS